LLSHHVPVSYSTVPVLRHHISFHVHYLYISSLRHHIAFLSQHISTEPTNNFT
jgi:hypothetical protein